MPWIDSSGQQVFSAQDAATEKGVSKAAILKAISQERIVAQKQGNQYVILGSELAKYQPGSYGDAERATIQRGPGRGEKRR